MNFLSLVSPQHELALGRGYAAAAPEINSGQSPKKDTQGDNAMAERKLRLLRRSGLFGNDTKGAVVERACIVEDLREAYRLVHDVFLGTGFIHPECSGIRLRIFETTSETATFIAKVNGRVVGVLSVVGDSPDLGLPSDSAFKRELDQMRATGARLCELTNQAVAEEYRRSAVPTELMRCAVTHAMKAGYHETIATVSPRHHGFYDLLGFREVGSERSYSQKLHDPVIALCMDVDRYRQPAANLNSTQQFMHRFITEGNSFLSRVLEWSKMARRHFLNPELLERLFVTESNFLAECTARELGILHRRWGQEMFEAVTATKRTAVEDGHVAEMVEFPLVHRGGNVGPHQHRPGTPALFLRRGSAGLAASR